MIKTKAQSMLEYAFIWGIVAISVVSMTVYMRNSLSAKAEDFRQDINSTLRSHEETTPFGYESPMDIVNWRGLADMATNGGVSRLEGQLDKIDSVLGGMLDVASIPVGIGQSMQNAQGAAGDGDSQSLLLNILQGAHTGTHFSTAFEGLRNSVANLK